MPLLSFLYHKCKTVSDEKINNTFDAEIYHGALVLLVVHFTLLPASSARGCAFDIKFDNFLMGLGRKANHSGI